MFTWLSRQNARTHAELERKVRGLCCLLLAGLLSWRVDECSVTLYKIHRDLRVVDVLAALVVPLPLPFGKVFFQCCGRHGVDSLNLDPSISSKYPVDPAVLLDDSRIQVVVRRKALREENVYRLQLVLPTFLVPCVIPFSTWKDLESRQQGQL